MRTHKKKRDLGFFAGFCFGAGLLIIVAALVHGCEDDRRYIYGPTCPADTVIVHTPPDTVTVFPPELDCDSCHNFHPHPHRGHK